RCSAVVLCNFSIRNGQIHGKSVPYREGSSKGGNCGETGAKKYIQQFKDCMIDWPQARNMSELANKTRNNLDNLPWSGSDCKDTDGAKAIADFKQCANFSATIQSIAKQCQQLKTKGLDACVQQLNHFINANKKNEDKETSTK
ncbi:unnamed protein product, partial [Medioppia subpectinata]